MTLSPTLIFLILLAIVGGAAAGAQGPASAIMTGRLGVWESIFIVHLVGAAIAIVPLVLLRGGELGSWRTIPWYSLLSGAFGVIVITAVGITIPRLGAVAAIGFFIIGQFFLTVLIDHFGWFSVDIRPVDWQRLLGLAIMLVGALFVLRR